MIILDTNILHSFALDSVSTDLLQTFSRARVDTVAVPWVVLEELVSHRAVPYREKHQAAVDALERLRRATPDGHTTRIPPLDIEPFLRHWRRRYQEVVDVLPTSDTALREALFREANQLPPCKAVTVTAGGDAVKTGGRDAAIWLTAVEYAREHPREKVYFVSKNWKDFGRGDAYPSPMSQDLRGLEDRFVHLTSLEELVDHFTTKAEVDEDDVRTVLSTPGGERAVSLRAWKVMGPGRKRRPGFRLQALTTPIDELDAEPDPSVTPTVDESWGWLFQPTATLDSVREQKAYRIGDHQWCIATVRWFLSGVAFNRQGLLRCGTAWETRILFSPTQRGGSPTVLRYSPPQAPTFAEWATLPPTYLPEDLDLHVAERARETAAESNLRNHLLHAVWSERAREREWSPVELEWPSPRSPEDEA
ncbi:PIN domain-containing protein [Actinacidiphila rubida]|uniref:PIN domain-containing protein n=1 Tax=Actinacidiphila rubida TaxID=310780 RepID=A0A1H8L9A7_9ACTN|nr:PIN domain-containing protein [Actinacidiphila rubida]SEO01308.1 PIN domain-containing protein [Actinacidiphila rubida]